MFMYFARRFINGDEKDISKLIKKDLLTWNIRDYSKEEIDRIIGEQSEENILKRNEIFHVYTFLDDDKIVGVGMIGPYWNSVTESSLFTIFIDPDYKGKGLGRKIIETLESDEYYKRADRVEIPASISAVSFYKHFGYGFKKFGNIVDEEGLYRMEKYPKMSNSNVNFNQYNKRPYIDNEYHNYKDFIYEVLNDEELFNEYMDDCNNIWIIELNGKVIGFQYLDNIYIINEYQNMGILDDVKKDYNEFMSVNIMK